LLRRRWCDFLAARPIASKAIEAALKRREAKRRKPE
jgi:hypothetical protein